MADFLDPRLLVLYHSMCRTPSPPHVESRRPAKQSTAARYTICRTLAANAQRQVASAVVVGVKDSSGTMQHSIGRVPTRLRARRPPRTPFEEPVLHQCSDASLAEAPPFELEIPRRVWQRSCCVNRESSPSATRLSPNTSSPPASALSQTAARETGVHH
jgi:hypothetical protein